MNRLEEPEAFGAALVAAMPKIRRFSFALTGTMADADDLLQATLERAWSKRDQFEPGTKIDRWLFRICKNIWIDEMRSKKVRGDTVEFQDHVGPPGDSEREVIAALTLTETLEASQILNNDHRTVLFLVGVEGLSYREAAGVLDLPVGTIMSRLARARGQLANVMEDKEMCH